jgi:hypothetical protein
MRTPRIEDNQGDTVSDPERNSELEGCTNPHPVSVHYVQENREHLDRFRAALKNPKEVSKFFLWVFAGHLLLSLATLLTITWVPDAALPLLSVLSFYLCAVLWLPITEFKFLFIIFIIVNGSIWGLLAALSQIMFRKWWVLPLIGLVLNIVGALFFFLFTIKT